MESAFYELRRRLESRIVERARSDGEYAALLRADPARAFELETGSRVPPGISIELVEDRADLVHVVLPFDSTSIGPGPSAAMTGIARYPKPLEARQEDVARYAKEPGQIEAPGDRDPHWYSPVFVVCTARSYSTLTTAMIGLHPQLFGFPELGLFRDVTIGGLLEDPPGWRGVPARQRCAGLFRSIAEIHEGVQAPESVRAAMEWLEARRSWPVPYVYDHLLSLIAPRVGVEKSPENSSREDSAQRLLRAYPRARLIHLVRHPATTAKSMYLAWKDKAYWDIDDALLPTFCLGAWLHHHTRLKQLVDSLPPDRGYRLRAEDLLRSPAHELEALCRWLGIDSSPKAVDAMLFPEASPFARLGPPGAEGGGDPGFLRDPVRREKPPPLSAALPGDWEVEPWLQLAVAELASQFGYDEP